MRTCEEEEGRRIRWEVGYEGRRMVEMVVPGRRKRGRPQRRWLDVVRVDMVRVGAVERDKVDLVKWGRMMSCDYP